MLDTLSVLLVFFALIPLLYFLSASFNESLALVILIVISIPTVMAMINGAPYVPTPMARVEKMVALAKLKPRQRVYDLGCGDGRFVFVAANRYGAHATGIELSPLVYLLAKIRQLFWRSKAEIRFGNFKFFDLSDAEVIFCYLLPETLAKIQPELDRQLKPGTRIYSYAFAIPSWKLIGEENRNVSANLAPVYIYEKQ
jgi:SAM-dependent methyltransferase